MSISLHLVLAVAQVTCVLILMLAHTSLRKRVRHFGSIRLFAVGFALVLVPTNVVNIWSTSMGTVQAWVLVCSLACILTLGVLVVVNWIPRTRPHKRVLAISAHGDDLVQSCGGTLARLKDAGHEVHALVLSRNPGADTSLGSLLGSRANLVDLPHGHLGMHEAEMVEIIESRISALAPDLILTHTINDRNPDHASVHAATLRAAHRHPAILCYESPSATSRFNPQVFVDIENYVDAKADAAVRVPSVDGEPHLSPDMLSASSSFRGKQGKMLHAEAYEAVRIPVFGWVL